MFLSYVPVVLENEKTGSSEINMLSRKKTYLQRLDINKVEDGKQHEKN